VRVAVVGGGITGLSAAYELAHRDDDDVEVVVVEASDRFGGKIRTQPFAGHDLDEAADAFLARVPDAVDLCRALGLGDDLVSPAARRAYLYSLGELRPFPEGTVLGIPTDLDALAGSGAVSPAGVDRARLDLTMGPDPARYGVSDPPDETVGAVVRRRVGDEVFERLVAPLLSGVHAGDADRLSLAAGAPQFAAALRDHRGLIEGLRAQRAAATDPDAPVFFGLAHGTGALVDALVDALRVAGVELRTGARLERIEPSGRDFTLELAAIGRPVDADAVILTTPLDVTSRLLERVAPAPAAEMAAVGYADVALVAMAVPNGAIARSLDGSGFLVAQPEGLVLTACSWASSKWAHLADPEVALLRASAGRADDTRAGQLTDADLVDRLLADLGTTMGVSGRPTEVRVTRWPRALPQFESGHLDRARAWQRALADSCPGLVIAGAGVLGLGIPACIGQGRAAARTVLEAGSDRSGRG
jgi:protoporphyrinogen/coproporphyrinogen III oxidase